MFVMSQFAVSATGRKSAIYDTNWFHESITYPILPQSYFCLASPHACTVYMDDILYILHKYRPCKPGCVHNYENYMNIES